MAELSQSADGKKLTIEDDETGKTYTINMNLDGDLVFKEFFSKLKKAKTDDGNKPTEQPGDDDGIESAGKEKEIVPEKKNNKRDKSPFAEWFK